MLRFFSSYYISNLEKLNLYKLKFTCVFIYIVFYIYRIHKFLYINMYIFMYIFISNCQINQIYI